MVEKNFYFDSGVVSVVQPDHYRQGEVRVKSKKPNHVWLGFSMLVPTAGFELAT